MKKNKKLEHRAKKRNIQNIILKTVSTAGVLSVGLIAPNVLSAMKKLNLLTYKRQGETILRARKRLIEKEFLKYKNGSLEITKKGVIHLMKETRYIRAKDKNRRWDGKWRVLIFDIPEKRRGIRDQIRISLVSIGFMRLQDSVWIYPYDCEDLITLLKADFNIGKDILYLIVEELEYDKPVREYFGLKD